MTESLSNAFGPQELVETIEDGQMRPFRVARVRVKPELAQVRVVCPFCCLLTERCVDEQPWDIPKRRTGTIHEHGEDVAQDGRHARTKLRIAESASEYGKEFAGGSARIIAGL